MTIADTLLHLFVVSCALLVWNPSSVHGFVSISTNRRTSTFASPCKNSHRLRCSSPPALANRQLPSGFFLLGAKETTTRTTHEMTTTNRQMISQPSHQQQQHTKQQQFASLLTAVVIGSLTWSQPLAPAPPAAAVDTFDDGDTVSRIIQQLQTAQGKNPEATFTVLEQINDIITEGTGIGGSINYKGVQLERGYVADEDTTIYNPGLTLLTEGEKRRLVQAIIASRQAGLQTNQWSEQNQSAFDYLRGKLDPFHMEQLQGYLQVFPVVAGVVYLAVLAVQQLAPRAIFPVAYFVGVLLILAPVIVLVGLE